MLPDEFRGSALFRVVRGPRPDGTIGRARDDGLILIAQQDVVDPVRMRLDRLSEGGRCRLDEDGDRGDRGLQLRPSERVPLRKPITYLSAI